MDERWLPIPEYPDYLVSNRGRVYSNKTRRYLKQTLLNSGKRGKRYWRFNVKTGKKLASGNNHTVTYKTHVIVARLFIGPCPPGLEILHIDECRDHNWDTNLKYDTHKQNCKAYT